MKPKKKLSLRKLSINTLTNAALTVVVGGPQAPPPPPPVEPSNNCIPYWIIK